MSQDSPSHSQKYVRFTTCEFAFHFTVSVVNLVLNEVFGAAEGSQPLCPLMSTE